MFFSFASTHSDEKARCSCSQHKTVSNKSQLIPNTTHHHQNNNFKKIEVRNVCTLAVVRLHLTFSASQRVSHVSSRHTHSKHSNSQFYTRHFDPKQASHRKQAPIVPETYKIIHKIKNHKKFKKLKLNLLTLNYKGIAERNPWFYALDT